MTNRLLEKPDLKLIDEAVLQLENATENSRDLDRLIAPLAGWRLVANGLVWEHDTQLPLSQPPRFTADKDWAFDFAEAVSARFFGEHVLIGTHRDRHKIPFEPYVGQYRYTGWLRLHAQDAVEAHKTGQLALALCLATLKLVQHEARIAEGAPVALPDDPAVRPLDLSNALKHAFMSGARTANEGDAFWKWPDYDPTKCPAYNRLAEHLTQVK